MMDAFPTDTLKIEFSKPGPTIVKPIALELTANDTTIDLHDEYPALKYYNGSLWFQGVLPMWASAITFNGTTTNVIFNSGRDQWFTLTPYDDNGREAQPLSLEAYTCKEYEQPMPCADLPSPPPPLLIMHNHTVEVVGGGRRLLAQSSEGNASDVPSSELIAAGAQAAGGPPTRNMCTAYVREISFLTSITLLTSLTGVNNSFAFSTGVCSMEYVTSTMTIPANIYAADLGNPDQQRNMLWCQSWPMHFAPPAQACRPLAATGCAVD